MDNQALSMLLEALVENWEREWVDYYAVLGVLSSADVETIIAVYRRLARKYGSPGGSEPDDRMFRLINEAKDILTGAERRNPYDRAYASRNQGRPPKEQRTGQSEAAREPRASEGPRSAQSDSGRRVFPVRVDYGRDIRAVIKDANFDSAFILNVPQIIDAYARHKTGVTTLGVELYQQEDPIGRYDPVLGRIDDLGYRPLDFLELLYFAAEYPSEQFKYPIYAFGSWIKDPKTGYIAATRIATRDGFGRVCGFQWIHRSIEDYARFAMTKK